MGKSRPQIANTLRLLNLPHKVQEFVQNKTLSAGHARALVGLDNAFSIAKYAMKKGMNVRQLENYITYVKKQKRTKSVYIEKHVKLKNSKGPDASTSIDTETFHEMISYIRIYKEQSD